MVPRGDLAHPRSSVEGWPDWACTSVRNAYAGVGLTQPGTGCSCGMARTGEASGWMAAAALLAALRLCRSRSAKRAAS
ncbi:MAG: hypothetical protein HY901_36850 [Deltaproteobacteria bacterium]|nr:hypothetical protein [Deltaproteobacteria bacterium]